MAKKKENKKRSKIRYIGKPIGPFCGWCFTCFALHNGRCKYCGAKVE